MKRNDLFTGEGFRLETNCLQEDKQYVSIGTMKALSLLYQTGLTREGVATKVGKSKHALRLYERGERFPPQEPYIAIVELAESRGITLMARDFIVSESEEENDNKSG